MAKKAMVERELKRKHLVAKYAEKRAHLKTEMKNAESLQENLCIKHNYKSYHVTAQQTDYIIDVC